MTEKIDAVRKAHQEKYLLQWSFSLKKNPSYKETESWEITFDTNFGI